MCVRTVLKVIVLLVGASAFLVILHLGPAGGLGKRRQVLDVLSLADGSRLCLLQFRNDHWLEAYTVALYRLYPDETTEATLLGFEDSYWWFGKLRRCKDNDLIHVKVWGHVACLYNPGSKETFWPGGDFEPRKPSRDRTGSLARDLQRYKQKP